MTTTEEKPDTNREAPLPRRRRSVVAALKSPTAVAIPHPALHYSVDEELQAGRRKGIDFVVFGVTAAIAVGFLVWGFVSTPSLKSVSGAALTWVMGSTGWLFILTASGFVVFVLWLALGRFGA